jgi:phosphoglycerate-specific signal transduction histidine kinase
MRNLIEFWRKEMTLRDLPEGEDPYKKMFYQLAESYERLADLIHIQNERIDEITKVLEVHARIDQLHSDFIHKFTEFIQK